MKKNNFDLNSFKGYKNYVIEASAGTGKTYNIIEIVEKLVNTKKEGTNENIKLNEILIVTYTEKAAGELKNRIREKLPNEDLDNAPIYTIHSFCQNVIKKYGIAANLSLNLSMTDDNELTKFANRYIRKKNIMEDIAYLYKYDHEFNVDSFVSVLTKCTQMYYLDKNYEEVDSIVSLEPLDLYKKLFDLKKNLPLMGSFDDVLYKYPDIKKHYDNLIEYYDPKDKSDIEKRFAKALEDNYLNNFNFPGQSFQKRWFNKKTADVIEAFDFFNMLKNDMIKITGHIILGALYAKDFYKEWQIEKELNKKQSFDDMIRSVREAIVNDDVLKNKLRNDYVYAVIDEFQDTNQKQFDIFSSIFMNDKDENNHNLIVVGDPKQSIYSFQGADVNVYCDAIKVIEKEENHNRLVKNYRSTAKIVDSCNKYFKSESFFTSSFEESDALRKTDSGNEYFDVTYDGKETKAFWIAKGTNGEEDSTLSSEEFAQIAVQQIIDCCTVVNGKTKLQIKPKNKDFEDVTFKDFTILTRKKSEMKVMETALKNAGIPYIRYKDNQLFLGKECADWIALLTAISTVDFTGYQRSILRKALFTNFFGLSLEKINSKYSSKDDIEQVKKINKWRRLSLTRSWKTMFDDIIINSNLNNNMKSLKELQSLSIYKQIAKYCIDYLANGKSLEELLRTLNNLSKGGEDDSDDLNGTIVEKSTNFECVKIMTMHASKGLEAPVVIASGGFKEPFNNIKVYQSHNDFGKNVISFRKPDNYVEEATAEEKRLFYVAYTRPKYILMLPYYTKFGYSIFKDSLEEYMNKYSDDYRTIKSTNENYSELRKKTNAILGSPTLIEDEEKLKQDQLQIITKVKEAVDNKKINKHSYSSLHGPDIIEEEDDDENKEGIILEGLSKFDTNGKLVNESIYDNTLEPITLPDNYPAGTKLGTALHEIFEGLDFQNSENELEDKIIKCFNKQGISMKDEWLSSTKIMVNNVLNAKMPIIRGTEITNKFMTLKEISFNNKLDEVEFNFNIFNSELKDYCNGFIDLMFKNGDYYSIVDWKSDRLNAEFPNYSTLESLKKHVDSSYSIQRTLYSYCLIKWLKTTMKDKSYEEIFKDHFGGVYYIFLRGCVEGSSNGVYAKTWNSWKELVESFKEIVKFKVGGNYDEL